jgi:hypothetical protein
MISSDYHEHNTVAPLLIYRQKKKKENECFLVTVDGKEDWALSSFKIIFSYFETS